MSIKKVAKLAGVSTATVSRYLNSPEQVKEKTRNKVRAAIEETGYAPNTLARNFRRGKTSLIVVVLPSIGDPFLESVMRGVWKVADELGYSILIRDTQSNSHDFDEYTDLVFSKQADGILLLASISPFGEAEARRGPSGQAHPPLVLGLESVSAELSQFPSVRVDNVAAAADGTEYLIQLGHKRIGFITGKPDSLLTHDREKGYRDAMHKAKLNVAPEWVVEGEQTIEGARRATRQLLELEQRPTAIFCANDEMALGALYEVKQAGLRVPQDISVIGFDDIRYAEIADPPLTTIAQPAEEIGERSMRRLCEAIEGKENNTAAETVPHRLVVRKSSANAPK
ncbi:LacI family DNA-binding transcriptional regulator [Microbulbifer hydrolyticus]|uniref:LacI family repressor for deo operon, udp, cdd, tsx, nupC, and nupG n=1 Tax=Microbulbifer hydrolyticus TaxID=48074 RepID=A0A6P1TEU5_9GAMM|nr:LacI family DNA-binding transcriptional regulator [Microbulbifer hydrolyticus]MBB5213007.1 LacI family repressor for deo operon, udp, cdd, tsx, nupC, and nupG [Microbulbifer hydrolyticus]QHQ40371.1 substrate-binding domain-containing protein [Microbulbifer hydrolyticus]